MPKRKLTRYEMSSVIAQCVQLEDVYMEDCNAQILESRADLECEDDEYIDVETAVGTAFEFNDDEQYLLVTAFCEALFIRDADKVLKKKKVLSIKSTFTLEYEYRQSSKSARLSPKSLKKYLLAFADVHAVFDAWPYFREFIQNTTTRMGLPPYLLPTYRIEEDQ